MIGKHQTILYSLGAAAILGLIAGCQKPPTRTAEPAPPSKSASRVVTTPAVPAEKPITPEKNPPGDIPDTQVFVRYKSTAGKYALDAPEGWARSEKGADVKFADKYDGEQVALSKSATAPTVASVQVAQTPALKQNGHAVNIQDVKTKTMPHGVSVVCVAFTSNSDPDPVTGKQVRLDNVTYYYYHQGTVATLTLRAPTGADNVDQWKRISESFRWL